MTALTTQNSIKFQAEQLRQLMTLFRLAHSDHATAAVRKVANAFHPSQPDSTVWSK